MKIWVVVADASRARVFSAERRNGGLQEVGDYMHPASRVKGRDLETDGPGRAFDSHGQGRHAMGKEHDVHEHEAEVFAHELGETINAAATANEFEKLYLVAPPKFMGLLRDNLDKNAKSRVVEEITKDLVSHDRDAIRKSLPDYL